MSPDPVLRIRINKIFGSTDPHPRGKISTKNCKQTYYDLKTQIWTVEKRDYKFSYLWIVHQVLKKNNKKYFLKILLLFRKSVNLIEMFIAWIRMHLSSLRIQDPDQIIFAADPGFGSKLNESLLSTYVP